jgi:cell division protein FtsB
MLKRVLFIVKNKFAIASLAFIVWMLFFDRNDLSSQMQYTKQKKNLEAEKEFYEKEILKVEKNLEELSSDPKKLEKFAREKYLMKKENEDIYILVEDDGK